jgi:hypothetical protein
MRTTLNIDEESLSAAARLTGVRQKTQLVRMGLEALIASEAAKSSPLSAALADGDRLLRKRLWPMETACSASGSGRWRPLAPQAALDPLAEQAVYFPQAVYFQQAALRVTG